MVEERAPSRLGIYLGPLTGLALIGWGLVDPYLQKRKALARPSEPEGSLPV